MEKDEEKFFYEDEVAMVSSKSNLVKYGLVLTTNRSRSDTDLKKSSFKSSNEIKVLWHPNGAEEIISDDKVVLMDRSLMPGDVVRKVNEGKPSQFGYCENIDIMATVKILNTNKIIENINSRYFTHTKPFAIDSSVFYESWVGGVYDVKCKVTFASQDGSIFTIEDPYRQYFMSLSSSDSFSIDDNAFYHGQKLKMSIDSLEHAKFITISNLMKCLWHKYKRRDSYKYGSKWIKVYVKNIAVLSVEVEWYCQTSSKAKPSEEHWPERIISGDNLKKLKTIDLFESCSIQVGDTHWYEIKDSDNLISQKQWRIQCTDAFNARPGSLSKSNKNHNKLLGTDIPSRNISSLECENLDDLLVPQSVSNRNAAALQMQRLEGIASKENKYKIHSKKSESNPSTSTMVNSTIHTLKSNRLRRNRMRKLLIKKSKQFNVPKVSTKSNSKVVVEICYTKSMIDVMWQDGTRETGVSSTDLYPVQTLDDLEFFPGDFVTEKHPSPDIYGVVESVDHAGRTARVQWFKVVPDNPSVPIPIEKTDISVYDLRDHPDFHFKSGCLIIHISPDSNQDLNTLTAGQVLSAGPDGKILVMWVNGEKTECWPQEIFVVKLHDDDVFSFQDDEYDDDDDAPLAVDDDLSEDWKSIPSSESSNRIRDQENKEKISILCKQAIKHVISNVNLFIDALDKNHNIDKVKLKKSIEHMRLVLSVASSVSKKMEMEYKETGTLYKDIMVNITNTVDEIKINLESVVVTEKELSYEIFIKESVDKLKMAISDLKDKVKGDFENSILHKPNNEVTSLKHCKKEDQSENNDVKDIIEPSPVLPITEPNPAACDSISIDTDIQLECEVIAKPEEAGVFSVVETLFDGSHKYINDKCYLHPIMLKTITKDIQILQKSLPAGIWVKTFENRMDLFSVMIRGPEKTPYAGGLFMFDIKLPPTYPRHPPLCHYYSFCDDRLNPNLYEDGKVCLSLLGTWSGHGVELWSPKDSNLLQLLVSIQGLILVSEPYYNEAGFESQRGQKLARENSRVYNEMALIKVVQSMTKMLNMMDHLENKNAGYFREDILEHIKFHGPKLISTIENWIKMSEKELTEDEKSISGYPLLPLSKGFCLSIHKALKDYKEVLISMNVMFK